MASSSSRFLNVATTLGTQSNNIFTVTSFVTTRPTPVTYLTSITPSFSPTSLAFASPSITLASAPDPSDLSASNDDRNWFFLFVPVAVVIAVFICIRVRDSKRRYDYRSNPERRIVGPFVPQPLLAMGQRTNIVGVTSNSREHRRVHDLPPAYPGPPPPKYDDVTENDPLAAVQMRLEDREDEQPLAIVQRRLTIRDDERPLAELQRSLTSVVVEENRHPEDEHDESDTMRADGEGANRGV